MSLSFIVNEPSAHNGEGEDRESIASVQMSEAHEFTPHAHTLFCQWHNRNNLYVHNETVRALLSPIYPPSPAGSSQNKLNHHRNLMQKQPWLTFMWFSFPVLFQSKVTDIFLTRGNQRTPWGIFRLHNSGCTCTRMHTNRSLTSLKGRTDTRAPHHGFQHLTRTRTHNEPRPWLNAIYCHGTQCLDDRYL